MALLRTVPAIVCAFVRGMYARGFALLLCRSV